MPPVKHLFGVGIGYQKVVHYKPVLVISKSRRPSKHRPPGWGWSGGVGKSGSDGGGGGYKSYTPVVVQQKSSGKRGYPYGPPRHHHRRKRKRPQHHHYHHSSSNSGPHHGPQHSPMSGPYHVPSSSGPHHSPMSGLHHSPSGSGSRGLGWRQAGWKRPPRNHRKGHDHHHYHSYSPSSIGGRYRGHSGVGGGHHYDDDGDHRGGGESYRHRPGISDQSLEISNQSPEISNQSPEISDHPPTPMQHHHDDYRDTGGIYGGGGVSNGGRLVYPSHSANYFGSPYSTAEDLEEGYESEIKEQWNKEEMTSTPSSNSEVSSTPSLYPFKDDREPPKSDTSVTSIHRDFLKNHMKNFHQFQDYQQATTVQPNANKYYKQDYQNAPFLLRPPGPSFSTMGTTASEERGSGSKTNNLNYYDKDNYSYEDKNSAEKANDNYDDTYYDNFDINRRIKADSLRSTQIPSTVQPASAFNQVNDPLNSGSSNNQPQIITAAPKTDKNFKPSPRVDEMSMGTGNSFNKPGFFPSFEQFHQIKMT